MGELITGIHHVTALADNSQKNIDFYCGILGIRLVKKTVNFDAPEVYHFYYGDEDGNPGSILTFFPYIGIAKGRHGKGMLNTTTFSIASASLDYWLARLKKFSISFKKPQERFEGETVIYFEDFDGLGLELVANDKDNRPGFTYGHIPIENSVKGFYSVEIWEEGYERTAGVLTEQMEHTLIGEKGNRFRFVASDLPGNYVDILCSPDSLRGLGGGGTVHHIAFSTPTTQTQNKARENLSMRMLNPTPVLDREYFTSVYFREPGGVLFEIATAGPGFATDESREHLGEQLKLPQRYEQYRAVIEKAVPPITINIDKFR
ncbi:MAG: ring-cleaving dioxygenase [Ginsengibacter sp.]